MDPRRSEKAVAGFATEPSVIDGHDDDSDDDDDDLSLPGVSSPSTAVRPWLVPRLRSTGDSVMSLSRARTHISTHTGLEFRLTGRLESTVNRQPGCRATSISCVRSPQLPEKHVDSDLQSRDVNNMKHGVLLSPLRNDSN